MYQIDIVPIAHISPQDAYAIEMAMEALLGRTWDTTHEASDTMSLTYRVVCGTHTQATQCAEQLRKLPFILQVRVKDIATNGRK